VSFIKKVIIHTYDIIIPNNQEYRPFVAITRWFWRYSKELIRIRKETDRADNTMNKWTNSDL